MFFSIGHSNHSIETFIGLLRRHGVTTIGDVRSHPYSRYVPQYSRSSLERALRQAGIAYSSFGKELGARSDNPICYKQGKVQYDYLAKQPEFADGIERVIGVAQQHKVALMCAEKDPLECHRALLVARKLYELGYQITHIHGDGSLENHTTLESRLLRLCKMPEGDLFKPRSEFVSEAYAIQGERVAYQDENMERLEKASIS